MNYCKHCGIDTESDYCNYCEEEDNRTLLGYLLLVCALTFGPLAIWWWIG